MCAEEGPILVWGRGLGINTCLCRGRTKELINMCAGEGPRN